MLSVVGCCTDYIPPSVRRHRCRFRFAAAAASAAAAEKGKERDKTRFQSLVGGRGVNA